MRKAVLLGILWIASVVGLVSAGAVIKCTDGNACKSVRAVVQQPYDVTEVAQKHPRAQEVDFHGNLLGEYRQPANVQWQRLNLSYNMLTDDKLNIRSTALHTIDLTYNRLTTVSIPSSVTELIAERNHLHYITTDPYNSIRKLILPKNKFDNLKMFTNLRNLEELDLSCNDLDELRVDELPRSLRILKLARNHIYSISGSNSLQSLTYLDLSHNILTTVLDSHTLFPSVTKLYLQHNKIVMWMNEANIRHELQEVNLNNNDWDCKNLENVLTKLRGKTIQGSRYGGPDCTEKTNFICCTSSLEGPYADRLIKYRKQQFQTLAEGANIREKGKQSCSNDEPNPCDGDDQLVYTVARSAMNDAKSLATRNLNELEQTLRQAQNIAAKLAQNVTGVEDENNKLSQEHANLVAYIHRLYSETLPKTEQTLKGKPDMEVEKLQQLFHHYEREYEDIKQQINAEERRSQDKVNEINTLEREMDDLKYQRDRLMEDVNKRNSTVNGYKARIEILQKQLG